jgi:hypothetical protein
MMRTANPALTSPIESGRTGGRDQVFHMGWSSHAETRSVVFHYSGRMVGNPSLTGSWKLCQSSAQNARSSEVSWLRATRLNAVRHHVRCAYYSFFRLLPADHSAQGCLSVRVRPFNPSLQFRTTRTSAGSAFCSRAFMKRKCWPSGLMSNSFPA